MGEGEKGERRVGEGEKGERRVGEGEKGENVDGGERCVAHTNPQ